MHARSNGRFRKFFEQDARQGRAGQPRALARGDQMGDVYNLSGRFALRLEVQPRDRRKDLCLDENRSSRHTGIRAGSGNDAVGPGRDYSIEFSTGSMCMGSVCIIGGRLRIGQLFWRAAPGAFERQLAACVHALVPEWNDAAETKRPGY
jgi:hypothetical protein